MVDKLLFDQGFYIEEWTSILLIDSLIHCDMQKLNNYIIRLYLIDINTKAMESKVKLGSYIYIHGRYDGICSDE